MIDYEENKIDVNDLNYLRNLVDEYSRITQELSKAIGSEAESKASLQILTGKVKSLQEQSKLIQEQIRCQKKKIDIMPR